MIATAERTKIRPFVAAARKGVGAALNEIRHALRPQQPKMILNFKEFCACEPLKRALLSYLVTPLLPPSALRDRTAFSNLGLAQQIPRALNELGYVVDIIRYDALDLRVSGRYDLFLGHGGINFEQISRQLSQDTKRIYFSTGVYWKEMNIRLAGRLYDLALRRGHLLHPDRKIEWSEEFATRTADGIICLGSQATVNTYAGFPLVLAINNATYPVTWPGWRAKDYDLGRDHFLFFSGPGNVHKGLDLLLEAFCGTKLHLHICQGIDPLFAGAYHHELTDFPNIHLYGHLPMRSRQFESLVDRCNWVISATCAEGQPGSVIECMGYGLIPILPESASLDIAEFGLQLNDCHVNTIQCAILEASKLSVSKCRERSRMAMDKVSAEYSPDHFIASFKSRVQRILTEAQQGR
ncbi:MAG: glycosyltransferase [Deltaproteobacteria bacterium]|nr:glycosyltransferase [Deltaproteobacteria bacterium]